MTVGRFGAVIASVALSVACTAPPGPSGPAPSARLVTEIDSPAGADSGGPNLAAGNDRIFMSWIESSGERGSALLFSAWDGAGWSQPRTIVSGVPFFVNWADFPSILPMADGTLAAHWPEKSGEGTYAYDVVVSRSTDGGASWSDPLRPHRDGTQTEHGFVSLVDRGPGRFGAVWLDGRNFGDAAPHGAEGEEESPEMTLQYAESVDGSFGPEELLDPRVCDCCQTTAVVTGEGLFVAYRDRSGEEVRDISFVRRTADGWSEPSSLHDDGWKISGCPVNGPSAAAEGSDIVIAWFTQPGEEGRVLTAFSGDGGATFGEPVRVDLGRPLGRVDVERLDDGSALVVWLEVSEDDAAEVTARRVLPDGTIDEPFVVARTSAVRASGFPRVARLAGPAGTILFAWTDTSDPSRVRVASLVP